MTAAQRAIVAVLAFAGLAAGATARAASASGTSAFCDLARPRSAAEQDRLLRFAALVRDELEASGAAVAIVARSGLNLARFGIRYSHAGISLRAGDAGPWSVRQLYFACDEARPRLYDQGLAGFVSGTDDPALGFATIVLLPREAADALAAAAADRARALALLADRYSANAHAWSLAYQNCNQWLAELLAAAWSVQPVGTRGEAQQWLAAAGYQPTAVPVGSHWLMAAAAFMPWLNADDHPLEDLHALRFRTSLPDSIEAFVRARHADARRIELCHDAQRAVVRRDGPPLAADCRAESGDRVIAFD